MFLYKIQIREAASTFYISLKADVCLLSFHVKWIFMSVILCCQNTEGLLQKCPPHLYRARKYLKNTHSLLLLSPLEYARLCKADVELNVSV